MHWGVDFGNTPTNNVIVASADGTVTYAGVMGGYGNVVMILHSIGGKTYETVYAHLASMCVKVGQIVKQGAKLGVKGTTGNSTGIHLHFEIHVGGRRNSLYTYAKDPMLYVTEVKPSVVITKPTLPQLPTPTKEVIRMLNPSSPTLKGAVKTFLRDAVKAGHITQKWADDFDKGQLSLDDAFAIKLTVEQRSKTK